MLQQTVNLRSLDFRIEWVNEALLLPSKLQQRTLWLKPTGANSVQRAEVAACIAALPQLTDLQLGSCIPLEPLLSMQQLRRLELAFREYGEAEVAALRQMHQLHELVMLFDLAYKLFLPGHRLMLRRIKMKHSLPRACEALATLPTLEEMWLENCFAEYVDSFAALPLLQQADISFQTGRSMASLLRTMQSLSQCKQLTKLRVETLTTQRTLAQSTELGGSLRLLLRLRSLVLECIRVPSLAFLTAESMCSTLTDVTLRCSTPWLPRDD